MPCLDLPPPTDTPPRPERAAVAAASRLAGHHVARLATRLTAAVVPAAMLAGMTLAAPQALAATAPAGATAPAAAESELVARARAWLAQAHQVSPSSIRIQPPDARLQAGACAGGWTFDRPFPQNDAVLRARCPDTQWQLFLSVGLPRGATPAPAASPQAQPAVARPSPAAQAVNYAPPTPQPQPAPVAWTPPPAATPAANPPQPAAPLVVRRGHTVLTTWSPAPGLEVSARLESLDDGRVGDMIRVRNRDTGRILGALVSGQGQAIGQ